MANSRLNRRLSYSYALLTGTLGLIILVRLFTEQVTAIDLSTLLAFTLTALILSYFRIPIGMAEGDLGLDGAILLGATLAGGPALGGWVAFVTGLVTSIVTLQGSSAPSQPWADSISTALLNGGRNVIATALAWWAYLGLEGKAAPTTMDTLQSLAVIILCVTFAIVRSLWQWPMTILQSGSSRIRLPTLDNLNAIGIELIPLPIALLTAATFVELGWSYFLLLVFVFAGFGALLRQMLVRIRDLQAQIQTAELTAQIRQAVEAAPDINALSTLAYDLCQRLVPAPKFEFGLYDNTRTHVSILISASDGVRLPPMRIPATPQWMWLGECREGQLIRDRPQLAQLPFSLPPLDDDQLPQAVMLVPITGAQASPSQETPPCVIGGIALFARHPAAFTEQDLAHIAVIADQIGIAISRIRQAKPDPGAKDLAPDP